MFEPTPHVARMMGLFDAITTVVISSSVCAGCGREASTTGRSHTHTPHTHLGNLVRDGWGIRLESVLCPSCCRRVDQGAVLADLRKPVSEWETQDA